MKKSKYSEHNSDSLLGKQKNGPATGSLPASFAGPSRRFRCCRSCFAYPFGWAAKQRRPSCWLSVRMAHYLKQ